MNTLQVFRDDNGYLIGAKDSDTNTWIHTTALLTPPYLCWQYFMDMSRRDLTWVGDFADEWCKGGHTMTPGTKEELLQYIKAWPSYSTTLAKAAKEAWHRYSWWWRQVGGR